MYLNRRKSEWFEDYTEYELNDVRVVTLLFIWLCSKALPRRGEHINNNHVYGDGLKLFNTLTLNVILINLGVA